MPGKKKHHTVPEAYLSAFTDDTTLGCVNVRTGKTFAVSKRDASTGSYFYAIPGSDKPDAFEDALGQVEGTYPPIRKMIEDGVWPLPADERSQLADYIAVQVTRGRDHRRQLGRQLMETVREMASSEPEEYERLLLLPGAPATIDLEADELPAAFVTHAHLVQMLWAGLSVPDMIKARRWDLITFSQPALITSDAPVAPIPDPARGPNAPLGFENALALQFPLTRTLGLWMFRVSGDDDATRGDMDRRREGSEKTRRAFNVNTTIHAHEQLFHHLSDRSLVPEDFQELAKAGGRTGVRHASA